MGKHLEFRFLSGVLWSIPAWHHEFLLCVSSLWWQVAGQASEELKEGVLWDISTVLEKKVIENVFLKALVLYRKRTLVIMYCKYRGSLLSLQKLELCVDYEEKCVVSYILAWQLYKIRKIFWEQIDLKFFSPRLSLHVIADYLPETPGPDFKEMA